MSPLKVAVTGANGQLGTELVRFMSNETDMKVYGLGKEELDIVNYNQVEKVLFKINPDIVIHSAAFTNVDLAEEEPVTAFLVNGVGTKNVALAASKLDSKLVYISSDYVFNGKGKEPIRESEHPAPLGIYGQSKLAGEIYVQNHINKFFIVRTSWIYGEHGKNFVKTMMSQVESRKQHIRVVNDQIGSPTYSFDLARAIVGLLQTERYGIFHITNAGSCSWYEFAKAIFEETKAEINVVPCLSEKYPSIAPRPKYSVLQGYELSANGFPKMRDWREALADFLSKTSGRDNNSLHEQRKLSRVGERD